MKEYMKEYWNFIDIALIFLYIPTAIVDICEYNYAYVVIANCVIMLLTFVKFCFYLRIFKELQLSCINDHLCVH